MKGPKSSTAAYLDGKTRDPVDLARFVSRAMAKEFERLRAVREEKRTKTEEKSA